MKCFMLARILSTFPGLVRPEINAKKELSWSDYGVPTLRCLITDHLDKKGLPLKIGPHGQLHEKNIYKALTQLTSD